MIMMRNTGQEFSYRMKFYCVENEKIFGDLIITHQNIGDFCINQCTRFLSSNYRSHDLAHQTLVPPDFMLINEKKCVQEKKKQKKKFTSFIPNELDQITVNGYTRDCSISDERNRIYRLPIVTESNEGIIVSSLVDKLLLDIYRYPRYCNREKSESDSTISSSRPKVHHCYLQKARLATKSQEELKVVLATLRAHIDYAGGLLIRQLRKRDYLRSKRDKQYDVVTAHLQAYSNKTSEDMRMRFSLMPQPGESGFPQWLDAMKMVARLPGGIPLEFRKRLWLTLAERHLEQRGIDWKQAEKLCFNEWTNPDDEELGVQIVKDLHRTGCSLFCGAAGRDNQAVLRRVLLGFARWNKSVGYCQGLNVLAALVLQVTDKNESSAVKVMIYLIEGVLPEGYFADNLRGLSIDMAVFRDLLKMRLPKLSKHLESLQNDMKDKTTGSSYEPPLTNVFTMQWFLTLFCHCLPQDTVLRVWDLIFLEGDEVLLKVALAIWEGIADRIMAVTSADEFYSIMGVLTREMLEFTDTNNLIKIIVNMGYLQGITDLREKHRYNITPWARRLSDDEDTDTEDDERMAVAAAIFGVPERFKKDRRSTSNAMQVFHSSNDGDKIALDIGTLKQQYAKLRERQRQAHIILSAACARQTIVSSSPAQAMNHLLVGKSALVSSKTRQLRPPPGSIPQKNRVTSLYNSRSQTRREKQDVTIHWKDMKDIKKLKETKNEPAVTDTEDTKLSAHQEDFPMSAKSFRRQSIDSDSDSTSTELCDEIEHFSDSEELTSTSDYYVMASDDDKSPAYGISPMSEKNQIHSAQESHENESDFMEFQAEKINEDSLDDASSISKITDQIRRLSADDNSDQIFSSSITVFDKNDKVKSPDDKLPNKSNEQCSSYDEERQLISGHTTFLINPQTEIDSCNDNNINHNSNNNDNGNQIIKSNDNIEFSWDMPKISNDEQVTDGFENQIFNDDICEKLHGVTSNSDDEHDKTIRNSSFHTQDKNFEILTDVESSKSKRDYLEGIKSEDFDVLSNIETRISNIDSINPVSTVSDVTLDPVKENLTSLSPTIDVGLKDIIKYKPSSASTEIVGIREPVKHNIASTTHIGAEDSLKHNITPETDLTADDIHKISSYSSSLEAYGNLSPNTLMESCEEKYHQSGEEIDHKSNCKFTLDYKSNFDESNESSGFAEASNRITDEKKYDGILNLNKSDSKFDLYEPTERLDLKANCGGIADLIKPDEKNVNDIKNNMKFSKLDRLSKSQESYQIKLESPINNRHVQLKKASTVPKLVVTSERLLDQRRTPDLIFDSSEPVDRLLKSQISTNQTIMEDDTVSFQRDKFENENRNETKNENEDLEKQIINLELPKKIGEDTNKLEDAIFVSYSSYTQNVNMYSEKESSPRTPESRSDSKKSSLKSSPSTPLKSDLCKFEVNKLDLKGPTIVPEESNYYIQQHSKFNLSNDTPTADVIRSSVNKSSTSPTPRSTDSLQNKFDASLMSTIVVTSDSYNNLNKIRGFERKYSSSLQSPMSANSIINSRDYSVHAEGLTVESADSTTVISPFYPIFNPDNKKTLSPNQIDMNCQSLDNSQVSVDLVSESKKRPGNLKEDCNMKASKSPTTYFSPSLTTFSARSDDEYDSGRSFEAELAATLSKKNKQHVECSEERSERQGGKEVGIEMRRVAQNDVIDENGEGSPCSLLTNCRDSIDCQSEKYDRYDESKNVHSIPSIKSNFEKGDIKINKNKYLFDGEPKSIERTCSSLGKEFGQMKLSLSSEDFFANKKRSSDILADLRHLEANKLEGVSTTESMAKKTGYQWEDLENLEARRQDNFCDSASQFCKYGSNASSVSITDSRKGYIVRPRIQIDENSDSILKNYTTTKDDNDESDDDKVSKLGVWTKVKPRKKGENGRRNSSDRALKIIQENSAILHKILRCQAKKRLPDLEEISKEITISPINEEISKIFSPILEKMGFNEHEINEELARINFKNFNEIKEMSMSPFDAQMNSELSNLSIVNDDNDDYVFNRRSRSKAEKNLVEDCLDTRETLIDKQINEELSRLLANYDHDESPVSHSYCDKSLSQNPSDLEALDVSSISTNVFSYKSSNDSIDTKSDQELIQDSIILSEKFLYTDDRVHDEFQVTSIKYDECQNLSPKSDIDIHRELEKLDKISSARVFPMTVPSTISKRLDLSSTYTTEDTSLYPTQGLPSVEYLAESDKPFDFSSLKSSALLSNASNAKSTRDTVATSSISSTFPHSTFYKPYDFQQTAQILSHKMSTKPFTLHSYEMSPNADNHRCSIDSSLRSNDLADSSKQSVLTKETLEFRVRYDDEPLTDQETQDNSFSLDSYRKPRLMDLSLDSPCYYTKKSMLKSYAKPTDACSYKPTTPILTDFSKESTHDILSPNLTKFPKFSESLNHYDEPGINYQRIEDQNQGGESYITSAPRDFQAHSLNYRFLNRDFGAINNTYAAKLSPSLELSSDTCNSIIDAVGTIDSVASHSKLTETPGLQKYSDLPVRESISYCKGAMALTPLENFNRDGIPRFDDTPSPKSQFNPFPSRVTARRPKELGLKLGLYSPTTNFGTDQPKRS